MVDPSICVRFVLCYPEGIASTLACTFRVVPAVTGGLPHESSRPRGWLSRYELVLNYLSLDNNHSSNPSPKANPPFPLLLLPKQKIKTKNKKKKSNRKRCRASYLKNRLHSYRGYSPLGLFHNHPVPPIQR